MRRSFDTKFIRPFEMRYILFTHIGIEFQNIASSINLKFCKHLKESPWTILIMSYFLCQKNSLRNGR